MEKLELLLKIPQDEMTATQVKRYNELVKELNELNWFEVYKAIEVTSENEIPDEPEQKKQKKKTEEQVNLEDHVNLEDKINAIFEMLPIIRETNSICQFMLENRWFNTAYKGYLEKDSQKRKSEQLYSVLDFYWIPHIHEKNVEILSNIVYSKQEHIDVVCQYLALEWLDYDRDSFRLRR